MTNQTANMMAACGLLAGVAALIFGWAAILALVMP